MNSWNCAWRCVLKAVQRYYEKAICYAVVFILTPLFYFFEMTIVRPKIIEEYQFGLVKQYFHTVVPTFLFINVTGNMMKSILTDTQLKKSHANGILCELCSIYRPATAWHCKTCNTCIMRRDHHCFFFSRCIGLTNRRYYVAYLGHIMISMAYSLYYNYYFISAKFEDLGFIISILRIFNPLFRFIATQPMGVNDLYALLYVINGGLLVWFFALFYYHIKNVLKGVTVHESATVYFNSLDLPKWKENMVEVFGTNWCWALVCPFVNSPVPDTVKMQ